MSVGSAFPMRELIKRCRSLGRFIGDTIIPAQCLNCGTPLSGGAGLCGTCYPQVTWLDHHSCDRCGVPLSQPPTPHRAICSHCHSQPPAFGRTRAVMVYSQASRDILLRFKHADRTESAPPLARWMIRAGTDLLTPDSVLVPVPLHWQRLFMRRYNQAALLAAFIAKDRGLTYAPTALKRARYTLSQGSFDHQSLSSPAPHSRRNNVQGAFTVPRPHLIKGRSVILIDDVMTTGATAHECSRELLAHGARAVDVLVVARAILHG